MEITPENQIPVKTGMLIIIIYLATFLIWEKVVIGNYSMVFLRAGFLLLVGELAFSTWKIPLSATFGRLKISTKTDWYYFLSCALIVMTLRLAVKMAFPFYDYIPLSFHNVLSQIIIAPLNEELWFRGFILGCLIVFLGRNYWSVAIAAFIFMACHVPSLNVMISTFLLSITLGTAFIKTRSILICILLHMLWNAGAFLVMSR